MSEGHLRSDVDADWSAAASDAGVDPASVVLYPLEATGNYGAMHFPPGQSPHAHDDAFAYTDGRREELRALDDRHVLVLDEALAAGPKRTLLLRHEAEHVAQYEANPAAAEVALRLAVALNAEWLYLGMPHERDADAAATQFRVANGIHANDEDTEGRDRFLYSAPWAPADRGSLPLRLLAFTLFYPDDFDGACTSNQYWPYVDPVALIDEMIEGGSTARAQLRDRFAGFLEALCNHGITQEQWDAMPRPERNAVNDELRERVVQAEAGAVEELRTILTPAG